MTGLHKTVSIKSRAVILLRLCEPGAVLAVARDMETAVIVRENSEHEAMRTAVVDRDIAQALALKGGYLMF